MKTAILSSGGVPVVNVVVSGPPDDSEFPEVEIKGVSFYTNVEYTRDGFKVWKAYNIGKGKVFSILSFFAPQVTNIDIGSQESQSEFLTVKSKKKSEKEDDDFHSESLLVSREDITKKRLPNVQDDDDALAAENETDLQDLQELVVQEVSLQHPIYYDRHNMCELISNSKMKRFAVPVLRQMCIHFDIDINDIKANLKQPYIDKLTVFVEQCSCAM
jgi:hypothetical protein